ncbi:MAG: hypothetical protein E4H14_11460 [Candidatus Thorarchaeota archaeon]|nr:MAG: hypothetical protein E4H14_11460 [Candidatus Thorarchaeota archaeon]
MKEIRENDDSNENIEYHIQKMTPEERDAILKEFKLMTEEERDSILHEYHEEIGIRGNNESKPLRGKNLTKESDKISESNERTLDREYLEPRTIFSVDEGRRIRTELIKKLDGLTGINDIETRLGQLVFANEIRQWGDFENDLESASKFLQLPDLLKESNRVSEIASRLNIRTERVYSWIRDSTMPRVLNIVLSIPSEELKPGYKWLPLTVKGRSSFSRYIQVPSEISGEEDFTGILNQLETVDSPMMNEYEEKFGRMSKSTALMYLTGLYISDGSPVSHTTTQSVGLVSSTEYSWCDDLCHAFGYSLGKIGIFAHRIADKELTNSEGRIVQLQQWLSSTSPLLLYLGKVVLRIDSGAKTHSEINLNWIDKVPVSWRISLLQGITDGDGFVSNNWYVGISSKSHQEPIRQLLKSLGIQSNGYSGEVRITRKEDIKKIGDFMFKHALTRQDELQNLCKRIENVRKTPYFKEEIQLMISLRKKGISFGRISEVLWEQHEISRRPSSLAIRYSNLIS